MNVRTRFRLVLVLNAILSFGISLSPSAFAQQQGSQGSQAKQATSQNATAPDQSNSADKNQSKQNNSGGTQNGKPASNGTSNDRLFYALPNFLTLENTGQIAPLTTKEKFKVVARSSFDYVEFPWYGVLAGISQAENSEPGYGQGAAGYGKRYASYFADGTIENFFTGAIMPSLLKQDPRFYQTSTGGVLHRTFYAVSRMFVTRTDKGGEEFNYSEIVGSGVASAISTYSYHPRSDRTISNTASVWGSQVGYDTITVVVKEFWPDIRKALSHKPQSDAACP